MTGMLDMTQRDGGLAEIKGWSFVPLQWATVTDGDTVLSPKDAMTWFVVGPPVKQHEAVTVRLISGGGREWVGDVPRDRAVHVLCDSPSTRRADFLGVDAVRRKKGQS